MGASETGQSVKPKASTIYEISADLGTRESVSINVLLDCNHAFMGDVVVTTPGSCCPVKVL